MKSQSYKILKKKKFDLMYTTDKIQKQVNPQRHSFYRQIFFFIFLFLLALQPNARYGLLIHEVFLDHTQPTQHSR